MLALLALTMILTFGFSQVHDLPPPPSTNRGRQLLANIVFDVLCILFLLLLLWGGGDLNGLPLHPHVAS